MRTALESKQTNRARLRDMIVGAGATRSAAVVTALTAVIAKWSLSAINASTFGLFANPAGTDVASIAAGSKTLTSPDNPWSASDRGKPIHVAGAGLAGGVLASCIDTVTNAGQVILRHAASTTVAAGVTTAGGLAVWGDATAAPYAAIDFGARSGHADDAAYLQAAIDAAWAAGGGVVYIPRGRFRFLSQITLRDGVRLVGDGSQSTMLDFSGLPAYATTAGFFDLAGAGLSDTLPVTVAAAEGVTQLTVTGSLAAYVAGDLIQVRSTEFYDARPINISALAYAALTAYTLGQIVNVGGLWYVCTTAGTTGAASPPSGTANPIADGTVVWYYAPMVDATYQAPWVTLQVVALGALRVTDAGRIYVCVAAGTTGAVAPSTTADAPVVDGTVTWRHVAYYNARKAEFGQVQSISGQIIYLAQPLRVGYPQAAQSAYTVEVSRVAIAKGAIVGATIIGKGLPTNMVAAGTRNTFTADTGDIGVSAVWASLDLSDVLFQGVEYVCVQLESCIDCDVSRIRFIHDPAHIDSQQYGVWVARGSANVRLSDYYGRNSRHILTTDGSASLSADRYRGAPCGITMVNGSGDGIWQSALDTHAAGLDIVGNGGVFNTLAAGIKSRSKRTAWSNMVINGKTDNAGDFTDGLVSIYYDGGELNLANIQCRGGFNGFKFSNVSGDRVGKISMVNCLSENAQQQAFRIGAFLWDRFGSVTMANCTADSPGNWCLQLQGRFDQFTCVGWSSKGGTHGIRDSAGSVFGKFVLDGFNITDSTAEAIYLEGLDGFSIGAGVAQRNNVANTQVRIRDCKHGSIRGLVIPLLAASNAAIALYLNATATGTLDRVTVDGVQADMPSGTATGVNVDTACTNVTIGPSCELRTCSTPISWNSGTGHRGGFLTGTAVYDPPSLVDGAGTTTTVAVVGAALGDAVQATFNKDLQGITVTGWVSSGGTVSVRFQNESGGTLDLASGTLAVVVNKVG